MRPQLVLPALLLGAVAALWLLLARPHATPATEPPAALASAALAENRKAETLESATVPANAEAAPVLAEAATDQPGPESSNPELYAQQRIQELADLGMTGDTNSLAVILSELTNRDPRVRRAARDAAVQFGSRAAIPALMDAWGQTDDPEEKVALQQAADFLKLPALRELHAAGQPQP